MKVVISQKIKELQNTPEGVKALRRIIAEAKLNDPKVFDVPSGNQSGDEQVVAQFIPVKEN